ncbi:MAG: TIGR03767 family metallophosphoesterase [Dehalococcoidia bacterium]
MARRRFLRGAGFLGAGAALAWTLGCGGGGRSSRTTLDGTIVVGEDGTLLAAPGEPYEVRTELAEANVGRADSRRSLVVFHHFADFGLLDEESPLRGEWQDSCPEPLSTSAFRPQETLTAQTAASLIRGANRVDRSPVTDRAVDFVMHTGNAIDNAQYNELRWFLELMDGIRVEPDSGGPGYEGVQSESPDARLPDLLAQAQLPFTAQGVRYPWYTALGNRDVLVQGNFPPGDASRQIAVGQEKIIDLSSAGKAEVCEDPSVLLDPERTEAIFADEETDVRAVTADADRRLIGLQEWMDEMFAGNLSPGPPGHGLTQRNVDDGVAYYTLEHGPLSFIVLDTVNPSGFATGSIDAAQFAWLEDELRGRSRNYFDARGQPSANDVEDRLIVVVSHHPRDLLNNPLPDPSGEERVPGDELEALLHRFPNVIAHVTGHSLTNRITARPDPERRGGQYWEIRTTSPAVYPMQGRLLEVTDNGDGTISLFSTMYDLDAPIDPRDADDPSGGDDTNEGELAAAARSVAAQDPQRDPEAAGLAASDRNAEMLLRAPFDLSGVETPARHSPSVTPEARRLSRRQLLWLGR